jgi:nucleoside-diphosphate-sugar epimerase
MNQNNRVLVTGADGFVGRHLIKYLAANGCKVIAASRKAPDFAEHNVVSVTLPDLFTAFDWRPLLKDCDSVVHLAGIAHTFADEERYDRINHQATERLAEAARDCGVHLVFASSISAQHPSFAAFELREDDPPEPSSAYGRSKLAAERAIVGSGASFTILRPVVMYGDGQKGNFALVHRVSRLPIPLPFGSLTAQRSVLSVQNFCSAIMLALTDARARGQSFIVSDPEPLSVAELITRYRGELGRPPGLLPLPNKLIKLLFWATGRAEIWKRIGCPLVARPTKLLKLGWNPV